MSTILTRRCLVLNRAWMPLGYIPVQKALSDMFSKHSPKKALKIEYAIKDGVPNFDEPTEMLPLSWDEWFMISPRPYDEGAVTTQKYELRIPTVVIAPKYDKIPLKTFKPSKRHIYNRDNGVCQYTGQKLSYKEATLDHIHPRSKGGGNTWENLALAAPEVNRKKADKHLHETDLRLLRKPKAPPPVPQSFTILREGLGNPDWRHFLVRG